MSRFCPMNLGFRFLFAFYYPIIFLFSIMLLVKRKKPLLKAALCFKNTVSAAGTLRIFLFTLSGGVDKSFISTIFCVDNFFDRRFKFPGKSRALGQQERPDGFLLKRTLIYTNFGDNACVVMKTLYPFSPSLLSLTHSILTLTLS